MEYCKILKDNIIANNTEVFNKMFRCVYIWKMTIFHITKKLKILNDKNLS